MATFNRLASVTDPLNHLTTFGYDLEGNLTSLQGPIPSIPPTTLTYNGAGQPLSLTDPLGKSWQFGYSGGDLTSVTDPLLRTTTRVSDYAGRLGSVTNPLGQASFFEYDPLNRLLSRAEQIRPFIAAFAPVQDRGANSWALRNATFQPTTASFVDNLVAQGHFSPGP